MWLYNGYTIATCIRDYEYYTAYSIPDVESGYTKLCEHAFSPYRGIQSLQRNLVTLHMEAFP